MTLQLELSPELEARLNREAAARGMQLEQYAYELLSQSLPRTQPGSGILTPESLEELTQALTAGSENLPRLPNETFTRESIYKEHP